MNAALSIHASAWPPNSVPRWFVWSGKTISSSRASTTGAAAASSERMVELHLADHADLVRRDPPLEEVGELLDVLEVHEGKRIACAESPRHSELRQALVRAVFE